MSSESEAGISAVRLASLIERFGAVLYPIDLHELLQILPEHGWVVTMAEVEGETIRMPAPPDKGGVKLVIDSGNKLLGVRGINLAQVVERYRELRSIVAGMTPMAPEVTIHYVELRYVGLIQRRQSPVEAFRRFYAGNDAMASLAQEANRYIPAHGSRLSGYGIRLAPEGLDANRPAWTELTLTPMNIHGTSRYFFDLIFRHPDSTETERVAEQANVMLGAIIGRLEGS